ncbi:beta-1,3-glucan-binding protein-like [Trichoplusia ni]|uniref:Beta-1,3-glucan-binding protein-like n=1 Tax=Trichoplusia ni TaxID=7111 RepID=A0A7E5WXT7_TRINI|nr:beta-1,3-glucan-binding protein-like [Trichoplusia ni]
MTCDVRGLLFFLIALIGTCLAQIMYEGPEPNVEVLHPKGFKVSLKDDGYSSFRVRGRLFFLNKAETRVLTERDTNVSKRDGYWVYENWRHKLEAGDTIFYVINVNKRGIDAMSFIYDYTVTESSCRESKTVVRGEKSVCEGSMIFQEEFEKTSLSDLCNWYSEIMFPREPDFPFNAYVSNDTISFEDGSLVIRPVLSETQYGEDFLYNAFDLGARCTGTEDRYECKHEASGANVFPPVLTAKISTRHHFNFKFGRIEVRAKLPAGSWLIPEINLEPSDHTYGQDHYESGFMRVAFARGNPSLAKKLYGGPVLSDTEPFRSALLKEKIGIESWNKDFHNYTLVWRPDGIVLLVDGEQYGTVSPEGGFIESARNYSVTHSWHWAKGTVMAPLDEMFHVTLGLRVGGINEFPDDLADKPWVNGASKARLDFWSNIDSWYPSWHNTALHVDYVRIYAL